MLKVYFSPSCSSCNKVRKYFRNKKIPFEEINIFKDLTYGDLLYLLTKSENGTDDIISMRSKIIKEKKVNIEKMKISEIINFILENPSILRRPIIVNDDEMQVGYNKFDITTFIPSARDYAILNCNNKCPTFTNCDHKINESKNKL